MNRLILLFCLLCVGCGSTASPVDDIQIVTAIPTLDQTPLPTAITIPINTTPTCSIPDELAGLPDYIPSALEWITVDGSQLMVNDAPYNIYGINYYPQLAPFERFLTDSDVDVIAKELDVIISSGINTLRIFVSVNQLISCDGQAVNHVEQMTLLDNIISTIAGKNLRMIIVLYQDSDQFEPTSWEPLQFVIQRYMAEPAILAWDVLDKRDTEFTDSTSEATLTWLANAILAIRQIDDRHLITTSWESDAMETIPLVDIVSFQHFGEYLPLRQEIANLKSATDKPIMLSAIGYSTFDLDETAQRNLLFQAFEEVQFNELAGWFIYMAFDYPTSVTCSEPDCPTDPKSINYYGIWNTSYFPKLAVDAVKRTTQTE